MQQIGLVKLRSTLSASEASLKGETAAFLDKINADKRFVFVKPNDQDPTLFLVLTGGSEEYFLDLYAKHRPPYLIMPTGERNSLAASLEIMAFLKRKGLPAYLLYGSDQASMLKEAVNAYNALFYLRSSRLGVIGGSSSWLIASKVDPKAIKAKLGVNLINVPMKEVLGYYDQHLLSDEGLLTRFESKTRRKEELRDALYVYGALKKAVAAHSLDGLTMKCFDLISARQVTACLAFALLNEEGIVAGCEGDIPSALTMMIAYALTGAAPFMANPANMDVEAKEAVYAHCTLPLSMVKDYSLATHFESGLSFALRGQLDKTEVTAIKLAPDLSFIRAIEGKIIANPAEARLCRTQIKVRFEEDIVPLLQNPFGNHLIFAYGRHKAEIQTLASFLGL